MSTRSLIAVQQIETAGTKVPRYKVIYSHFDGYPEGVGMTLAKYYNDTKKAQDLVALGDISSLRERVAPNEDEQHSYENSLDDVTVAYGRDRGEENTEARIVKGAKAIFDFDSWQEYIYIWKPFQDLNSMGVWECYRAGDYKKQHVDLYKLLNEKKDEK